MPIRIDVILDLPTESPSHAPTVQAVRDAAASAQLDVVTRLVRTPTIDDDYFADLPDGVVIGPGTPYDAPAAAERVIRTAREKGLPLVAT